MKTSVIIRLGIFTAIFCFFFVNFSFADEPIKLRQFNGKKIDNIERVVFANSSLKDRFSSYELYQFNAAEVSKYLSSSEQNTSCILRFGEHTWAIDLKEINLKGENFRVRGLTENGIIEYPVYQNIHTYAGFSNDNIDQTVRFTTGSDYFAGMIKDHFGMYIIEPLTRYSNEASVSEFIIYRPEDVTTPGIACGSKESSVSTFIEKTKETINRDADALACHTIDYAMALDYLSYKKMGSPANTQTIQLEMLNVLNLVNEIYTGMQSAPTPHILTYKLSEIFVEQTDANTFNSSMTNGVPNADQILAKFGGWVNGGGFLNAYGMATLWTSRGAYGNINDLTFSFAINGLVMDPKPNVCHNNKVTDGLGAPHNLVKWGYFDSWGSSVLEAHEMGHNWSSVHNGQAATPSAPGNTDLMTNGVNPGTWKLIQFEYDAINAGINDAMTFGSCFKNCDAVIPVADYITTNGASSTLSSCSGNVAFVNRSTGASSWVWDFGDGSPTSTQRNPIHQYASTGSFTVTLKAMSGTQTVTKTSLVIVNNITTTSTVNTVGIASTTGSALSAGLNDKIMYFDVLLPTIIKTVIVPVNLAGYITIEIYDNNMKTIFKKLVNVTAGDNKVTLNAELGAGTNYSIGLGSCSIGLYVYRSNSNLAFPYVNSGSTKLISINKSNNDIHGGTSALIYYYFYNWEVQQLSCLIDPTGIVKNNISSDNDFLKIYPNPIGKELNIEFKQNFQPCSVEIYNVLGELILKNQYQYAGGKTLNLPVNLRNGTYFLKVNTTGNIFLKKIIVND
ncbi:MAG: T9SS type A sorting domain-containing protein [Bacteroidetes bacterium]|nr:T9SS type A sorting domain-containing protein [Bacteroidota bacterium]